MRFDPKALALTFGLLWGGCVLCAALAHLVWPAYGTAFLDAVASIYPGYQVGGGGTVVVGTLYALLDGAVCGALFAWVYNRFATPR